MNNVQLYLGDCMKILSTLDKECVDLIYADMMYDCLDFSWIDECIRVLSSTGSIYVQTDQRSVAQLKLYLDDRLIFRNWIIWCYKAQPQRKRHYQKKHDDILFYTKSDDYTWNNPTQPPSKFFAKTSFKTDETGLIINPTPAMREKGYKRYIRPVIARDWWDDIPVPSGFSPWDTGKKIHPWQKPIALIDRIIMASSNKGDTVLDPFMGSGTAGVSAVRSGRNFIGIEIEPNYYTFAEKRIKDTQ